MRITVDNKEVILLLSFLYSATYFVIPLLIPPLLIINAIEEKLLSCPTKATPVGPIRVATTFTLIKLVNIFTKVDIAVKENTFIISAFETLLYRVVR